MNDFLRTTLKIAIPASIQALILGSLLPIIDQTMISQLGEIAIDAIGIAGKPIMIFIFVLNAIQVLTGIMLSQYIGRSNSRDVQDTMIINLRLSLIIAGLFTVSLYIFAKPLMSLYTNNDEVIVESVTYLKVYIFSTVPLAITNILSTYFRTIEKSYIPMYIGIVTAISDVILNYGLIFGNFGLPRMEVQGAAIASLASLIITALLTIVLFYRESKMDLGSETKIEISEEGQIRYFKMFSGLVIVGLLFSLSENVYGMIYGRMGTEEFAALCIIYPIMGIVSATIYGFQSAASIQVGKCLQIGDKSGAYSASLISLKYVGLISFGLSVLLFFIKSFYLSLFGIDDNTKQIAEQIMIVYLIFVPIMMLNLVLSQAILKAGGKIKLPMLVDIIGMWGIGVPTSIICSSIFHIPIVTLFFVINCEQIVRLILCLMLLKRKDYLIKMDSLQE